MANEIKIVQGDYKHIKVEFIPNNDNIGIIGFWFSVGALNISKHITEREGEDWYITLTSEETAAMSPCLVTYDITVETEDGKIITGLYMGDLYIFKKCNTCVGV